MSNDYSLFIEEISVDDVIAQDTNRYNSNNHWVNNEPPEDYRQVLQQGEAHHWMGAFKTVLGTIPIKPHHIHWLRKASSVGSQTKKFSRLYQEELDDLLAEHKEYDHLFADNTPYFVRTNTVSLKYGQHGVGPYYDLRSIIESAVTCIPGHSPIHEGHPAMAPASLTFYLLPWVPIDMDCEFRVFVCENRITAISQQVTMQRNRLLAALPAEERNALITSWVQTLHSYWRQHIVPIITHTSSYTIDLALLRDDEEYTPYFIEINCFGKEYAAGSALFHWLIDEDVLYGRKVADDRQALVFRYAI